MAAECLLAAFGYHEPDEPDESTARAYVGALRLLEHMGKIEGLISALMKPAAGS